MASECSQFTLKPQICQRWPSKKYEGNICQFITVDSTGVVLRARESKCGDRVQPCQLRLWLELR